MERACGYVMSAAKKSKIRRKSCSKNFVLRIGRQVDKAVSRAVLAETTENSEKKSC
jgi:hypothetical protein